MCSKTSRPQMAQFSQRSSFADLTNRNTKLAEWSRLNNFSLHHAGPRIGTYLCSTKISPKFSVSVLKVTVNREKSPCGILNHNLLLCFHHTHWQTTNHSFPPTSYWRFLVFAFRSGFFFQKFHLSLFLCTQRNHRLETFAGCRMIRRSFNTVNRAGVQVIVNCTAWASICGSSFHFTIQCHLPFRLKHFSNEFPLLKLHSIVKVC